MRISHQRKFVFLSRYKCASSTIRRLLDPYSDVTSSQRFPYYHHTPLAPLKRHFEAMGWNWDEYLVFTSVRNPWRLAVSLYEYGLPDREHRYWWERHWDEVSREIFHPAQRRPPEPRPSFREWALAADFTRFKLEAFTRDEEGRLAVHEFVRVESIATDLQRVGARLGIVFGEVPHLNRAGGAAPAPAYDRETAARIAREFAADLAFGLPSYAAPERARPGG